MALWPIFRPAAAALFLTYGSQYTRRSRLEKQPTDLAAARQTTAYFGDRKLDGSNSETKCLHRLLLVAIERTDFLEPFMQRRDEV
jgi:hypothetical protein